MKKKIDWRIIITGMLCLTIIEIFAQFNGIDGVLLTTVVGIIAGLIGFIIPSPIKT